MGLDLCACRCAWVASFLRSPGFLCRVLALLGVLGLVALLRHYPVHLTSLLWNIGSYRAQSGASVRRPRVVAHFPCLGKPEATPMPMFIMRR